jgi:hypothetical protein
MQGGEDGCGIMELRVGQDVYKAEYYKRRDRWFIRKNKREAVYDENNVWVEFTTQGDAEEYLRKLADNYEECEVVE